MSARRWGGAGRVQTPRPCSNRPAAGICATRLLQERHFCFVFISPAESEAETMVRVQRGNKGASGQVRIVVLDSKRSCLPILGRRRRKVSALPGSPPLIGIIKKLFFFVLFFFMLIELKEQSCVQLSVRGSSSERVPVPAVTSEHVHPGSVFHSHTHTHRHTATEATVGPDPSICGFTRLFIRPSFPSSCHSFVRPSPFICCYYQAGEKKV